VGTFAIVFSKLIDKEPFSLIVTPIFAQMGVACLCAPSAQKMDGGGHPPKPPLFAAVTSYCYSTGQIFSFILVGK